MPVIRKASTSNHVVLKKDSTTSKSKVQSTRAITTVEEFSDVDALNPQDGFILVYDSDSDKFKLVDPDVALSQSVADNDLPDDFIDQLEQELDIGDLQIDNLDGGGFV